MREGMDFFRGTEVDAVDFVDDLPKKEAAVHPIDHALENAGDHVPLILAAVRAPELAQILKKPLPLRAVRPHHFLIVDEAFEIIASNAVFSRCPITPAV